MPGNTANTKTSTGSIIQQPTDPDLPKIRSLSYPVEDGARSAVITFENRAQLRFYEGEDGVVVQESIFSDGDECESLPITGAETPNDELMSVLDDYATLDKDDLRRTMPGFWPVLDL